MTDVTIVGLGLRPIDHLSRETERRLKSARVIFYVDAGLGTVELLQSFGPPVVDLYADAYLEGGQRIETYQGVAARILDEALLGPGVVLALTGHPVVFSYVPFLVRDGAGLLGLSVEILPGIGALEALLAEIPLDPCAGGLQMYEATDLLLRRRAILPDVPLLVWQPGNVGSRLHTNFRSLPERFVALVRHLLQFHPANHPVEVWFASPHPLVAGSRKVVELSRLAELADELHPGVTLYLPPSAVRPVSDPVLRLRIDDPAWLASVTR